jgi:hypothetical protein
LAEAYTAQFPETMTDVILHPKFKVFSPLIRKIEVTPQEIIPFEREGFTVIEWGGTLINYALGK